MVIATAGWLEIRHESCPLFDKGRTTQLENFQKTYSLSCLTKLIKTRQNRACRLLEIQFCIVMHCCNMSDWAIITQLSAPSFWNFHLCRHCSLLAIHATNPCWKVYKDAKCHHDLFKACNCIYKVIVISTMSCSHQQNQCDSSIHSALWQPFKNNCLMSVGVTLMVLRWWHYGVSIYPNAA